MKQPRHAPIPLLAGLLLTSLLVSACGFLSSSEEPTPEPTGPVRADFYADKTEQQGEGWVGFTSSSTGDLKEWLWDFNGDGVTDANGPIATKYYNDNGYFSVTLSVEGWDGSTDTMTKADYIYVWGCGA